MLSKLLLSVAVAVSAASFCNLAASAASSNIIQRGGPYISQSSTIQSFSSEVFVDEANATQPMTLTVTNGENGQKFAWVRMWVTDGSVSSAKSAPKGRMIINEYSFRTKNSVDISMTNGFAKGKNGFYIQAAGLPGATVSWVLKGGVGGPAAKTASKGAAAASASAVSVSGTEPQFLMAGSETTINGSGFGTSNSNATVMVTQKYRSPVRLTVSSTTNTAIKVAVPTSVAGGSETLTVTIGNQSATAPVNVLGQPELLDCASHAGPVGTQFSFTVKNMAAAGSSVECRMSLSGDPKDPSNVATAGNVSKDRDNKETLTVTMPQFPALGDSPFFNPPRPVYLFVKVGGVPTKQSNWTLYCSRAPW